MASSFGKASPAESGAALEEVVKRQMAMAAAAAVFLRMRFIMSSKLTRRRFAAMDSFN